jgi:predicted lipid-binding transport protein (Tim44 family)
MEKGQSVRIASGAPSIGRGHPNDARKARAPKGARRMKSTWKEQLSFAVAGGLLGLLVLYELIGLLLTGAIPGILAIAIVGIILLALLIWNRRSARYGIRQKGSGR